MNIPPSSAALSAQLLQTSRLPGAAATAPHAGPSADLFGFQAMQDVRTLGIPPSRGESAEDLRQQFLDCLCR